MITYIIKKILGILPVLFIVTAITFSILHITPGGPAAAMLGIEASAEEIYAFNERLGLNEPLVVQYVEWIKQLLTGDLGESIFMRQSVLEAIREHLEPTLSLSLLSLLIASLIGIPIGIAAAYKNGSWLDLFLSSTSLVGIAMPSFLLGMFLMLLLSVVFQVFPVAGYRPLADGLGDHLYYLSLPALSLGMTQSAIIARMTRSAMLDVLKAGYIKTARAKGLPEYKVLFKHALKNASIPILTVVGYSFAGLLAGSVVVESLFNIPGIGQLVVNAIKRRDFPVIQGTVLTITLVYILVTILLDVLYAMIDSRMESGQ